MDICNAMRERLHRIFQTIEVVDKRLLQDRCIILPQYAVHPTVFQDESFLDNYTFK